MNIQEIRQKYPQYNDLSDEQLAQGLHQKFYADLPFATFAERIGFAEQPAMDPEASMIQMMGTPLSAQAPAETKPTVAEQPKPQEVPYKSVTEALDDAVNYLQEGISEKQVKDVFGQGGIKWEDIVAHAKKRGVYVPSTVVEYTPEQVEERVKKYGALKAAPETEFAQKPVEWTAEALANVAKRTKATYQDVATSFLNQTGAIDATDAAFLIKQNAKERAAAAPSLDIQQGMNEISKAESYGDAIVAMASNPRATFTMLVDSLAVSIPALAPALVLGPAGMVVRGAAAGLTSGGLEYGTVMADVLQDKGVDLSDAMAIERALKDPKIMAEIKEKGAKRGLTIGAFDALTMGLAGRFLEPVKKSIAAGNLSGTAAKKATMAAWGKELSMQAAGGGGGEFAAQKLTGENKPAEVLLETFADIATAPLEVRSNLREARDIEAARKRLAVPSFRQRMEPQLTLPGGAVPTTDTAPAAERVEPAIGEQPRITIETGPEPQVPPVTATEAMRAIEEPVTPEQVEQIERKVRGPAPAPEIEEEAPAAAEAPTELPKTKEELFGLLKQIEALTGEKLTEADRQDALQQWEARQKETPVKKLQIAGEAIADEVKREAPDTQTYVAQMQAVEVPVADLTLSKDVPQFKSDANEQGVVERLGGKFEREGLAPIQVWQRLNGDLEVISGRHRLDLARRSGEQTIPAQIFKESEGFDAKRAAIMDAELNIRDEKGKVKDYVTYFKETKLPQEEAESRGLLARGVGKRAYTIANDGTDELITALRNEAITDEGAFVIAKNAPNDARLQAVGIQAIQKGLGIGAAANKMQALKALAGEADTSLDMFGFDSGALKEAEEMGKIADRKQREIGTRLAAISGAAKNPKLAKQEGIDIKDPNAVAQRVEELRQLKASWENWPTNPQLREEIRAEMGRPAAPKAEPVTEEDPVQKEINEALTKNGMIDKDAAIQEMQDNWKVSKPVATAAYKAFREVAEGRILNKYGRLSDEEYTKQIEAQNKLLQKLRSLRDKATRRETKKEEVKDPVKQAFSEADKIVESPEVRDIKEAWIGGVADLGDREPMYLLRDVPQGESYIASTQAIAKKYLGDRFMAYRLMSLEEYETLSAGDLGEIVSFTLDKSIAQKFKNVPKHSKRNDLVIVQVPLTPEHVLMFGKESEQELIIDTSYGWSADEFVVVDGKQIAEEAEEKRIADREVELFKLQPTVEEKEMPTMEDMFGAKDMLVQPPKRPPILDKASEVGLFKEPEPINAQVVADLPTVGYSDIIGGLKSVDTHGLAATVVSISKAIDKSGLPKSAFNERSSIRQIPMEFITRNRVEPVSVDDKTQKAIDARAKEISEAGAVKPLVLLYDDEHKTFSDMVPDYTLEALIKLGVDDARAIIMTLKKNTYDDKAETQYVEKEAKDVAQKLQDDFMIGDMVRVGSAPGVIVGIEGDYVRFHPDRSASPKAYRRVQKKLVTLVSRPDTKPLSSLSTQKDQDQRFGEQQGQLKADMGGLIQLLGANMYASNVADVALKELIQNAFDAVKGAVSSKNAPSLYKSGKIHITVNRKDRTITIEDNARGMTPEIVQNAFFTVAGSDKSDLDPSERSGGLGLAKMGFMLGSESLKLDTVRDGVRVTVDTTAKDIANSNFKIKKSPAKKGEHGTKVTVKIPDNYTDPKTGDQKTIWFPWSIDDNAVLRQPLIGPVEVTSTWIDYGEPKESTLPIGVNFQAEKYQQFKVNFEWGSADIYFGIERNDEADHKVLSSGVYQFDTRFKMSQSEKIPYNVIVNVKPNVDAKHPDYPFENSRERFKGRLEKDIEALGLYLSKIARGNEAEDLKENFKNIVSMPRTELGKETKEVTDKLRKAFKERGAAKDFEIPPMPKEVTVTEYKVMDTKGNILADVEKEKEKKKGATFEAETEAPGREEFMIPMSQDPRQPIFHNNTNLDVVKIGSEYGDPQAFFGELGTLMVEMKEALGKSGMYGYDILSPENMFFGGISIDKNYGGVHIKLPYKAVLINPFYDWGAKTLFGIRANLLNTMIHEVAHTGDMSHDVGFINNMLRVEQFLEDEGLMDYFRDALMDVLVRHESTFTAMREAYGRSTTKNTAKSLEDYEKSKSAAASRRAEAGREGEDGAAEAGEGAGSDEVVRARGKRDKERNVGGGTGEEVRNLLDRTGRINTPMLSNSPVKDLVLRTAENGKKIIADAIEDPAAAARNVLTGADRGLLNLRNKNIWFGSGLNAADLAAYNGQLRTSEGLAVASVALDNAIRGGTIGVQVIELGGIAWKDAANNFVATKADGSMSNIYKIEAKLKKKIGEQTGQDLIQGYLEAKRSRSIQNEFYDRQEQLIALGDKLDQATDPETVARVEKELKDAEEDLNRIQIVYDKISMTDEEIDEFISQDQKFPELREIMDNWTAVNQNLLRFWKETSMLSEARYERLSNIKDYVPWQRIMSIEADPHSPIQSTNKTMINVGKEKIFKKGSPKVTTSFIAKSGQTSFVIQPSSVVSASVNGVKVPKNKMSVTSDGRVELAVPIKAGDTVTFDGIREIENIIDNMTRNVMMMTMNGLRNYAANRIVAEYGTRNAEGKIRVFKKADPENGIFNIINEGRRIYVQIADPLIAESAIGMETMQLEAIKIFGAIANITRRSITLSGTFQIKQVFKDAPQAALITGIRNPAAFIMDVWKGFGKALVNQDETVKILKAAGIGGFHSPARTPEAEIKRKIGIINRSAYSWMIAILDHIGDSSDVAQRVATYNRVMKETGDETQAIYQAANVINFLHHGSGQVAQMAVRTVPFMGAYANSIDVLFQALAGGGLKGMSRKKALIRLAQTGSFLVGMTFLYCMLLGADDDYWELDDQTRLRNVIVPFLRNKDGSMIMFPMNTGAAFFFKAIPELIYHDLMKKGTDNEMDGRRLRTALKDSAIDTLTGPTPLPAALKPAIEVSLNHNFFTAREVTPRGMQDLEKSRQYLNSTSALGKLISNASGGFRDGARVLSPIEADHIIRGMFGTGGSMAMWFSNVIDAATSKEGSERPAMTLKEQPIVGAFVSQPVPRGREDLFYDFKDVVTEKYKTYMSYIDSQDTDGALKYFEKNSDLIAYYDYVNDMDTSLKEINAEIRRLGKLSPAVMSAKEKRDMIDELSRVKNEALTSIREIRRLSGL